MEGIRGTGGGSSPGGSMGAEVNEGEEEREWEWEWCELLDTEDTENLLSGAKLGMGMEPPSSLTLLTTTEVHLSATLSLFPASLRGSILRLLRPASTSSLSANGASGAGNTIWIWLCGR